MRVPRLNEVSYNFKIKSPEGDHIADLSGDTESDEANKIEPVKAGEGQLFTQAELLKAAEEAKSDKDDGTYPESPSYMVQLDDIVKKAEELKHYIKGRDNLPAWVQNKITLAHHNIDASLNMYRSKEYKNDEEDCDC